MARYECNVCGYIYDESAEGVKWGDLPHDYACPVCAAGKDDFTLLAEQVKEDSEKTEPAETVEDLENYLSKYRRTSDEVEGDFSDIQKIARSGESIIEPMRTRKPVISWDDILIKGAQLSKLPLNKDEPVATETVIGSNAEKPLVIDTPVIVSHMSFGSLSREVKIAMEKGSAAVGSAICSGEGGMLEESLNNAKRYIFEYVPNEYSVTDENLKKVGAVEIKIGQSAKPGMGGHLPGDKVTDEISAVRGFPAGKDIISPSRFKDITGPESLRSKVAELRKRSGGAPIGIKLAAGHIEADLEVALFAEPDFITIDGRAGATGAAPRFVKDATSVPTIYALSRAVRYFRENKVTGVSLIITGGLRISPDIAKAIAMGADVVALATSAMIACGCQQYRVCNTGKCPVGIATQDSELRDRFDIDLSAEMLANFLKVTTDELRTFARLTGNSNVHDLNVDDLFTTNAEISDYTDIPHA